jgi:hypothetical protein
MVSGVVNEAFFTGVYFWDIYKFLEGQLTIS